ncbi:phosphonate C-P lyase system protein PhnL [Fundidesulfovibrio butyratiphilus]
MFEDDVMIAVEGLAKRFVLHVQGGAEIEALSGVNLVVRRGECVALDGPSGAGKSTLLRSLYANYQPTAGRVFVRLDNALVDMAAADPRTVLDVRRRAMAYVSQFLRVIPRVAAVDLVAEPLEDLGEDALRARERAGALLARLNVPRRLWGLAPATFSGGEQQRVNLARGFSADKPVLLLDEPTASLDAANRQVVVELIREAKAAGRAVVGIFHDEAVRDVVADRLCRLEAA